MRKIIMDNTGTPRFENPKPPQRYTIQSDDSGHKYFIPVDQVDEFEAWVAATEADDFEFDGPEFDSNRINGSFSFTDPRCE